MALSAARALHCGLEAAPSTAGAVAEPEAMQASRRDRHPPPRYTVLQRDKRRRFRSSSPQGRSTCRRSRPGRLPSRVGACRVDAAGASELPSSEGPGSAAERLRPGLRLPPPSGAIWKWLIGPRVPLVCDAPLSLSENSCSGARLAFNARFGTAQPRSRVRAIRSNCSRIVANCV